MAAPGGRCVDSHPGRVAKRARSKFCPRCLCPLQMSSPGNEDSASEMATESEQGESEQAESEQAERGGSSADNHVDDMEEDGAEGEYVVEKIIKSRVRGKRKKEYYVKWKGYDDEENDNTWEPADNLHPELVADFERDHGAAERAAAIEKEEAGLSEMERKRLATIRENAEKLAFLGLGPGGSSLKDKSEPRKQAQRKVFEVNADVVGSLRKRTSNVSYTQELHHGDDFKGAMSEKKRQRLLQERAERVRRPPLAPFRV